MDRRKFISTLIKPLSEILTQNMSKKLKSAEKNQLISLGKISEYPLGLKKNVQGWEVQSLPEGIMVSRYYKGKKVFANLEFNKGFIFINTHFNNSIHPKVFHLLSLEMKSLEDLHGI